MTFIPFRKTVLVGFASTLVAISVAACSSATEAPTPTATPETDPELEAILATTDLGPGINRFAFLLLTPLALVTVPEVEVASYLRTSDGSLPAQPTQVATAVFHLWPFGTRGSYVTELNFEASGSWIVVARVDDLELGELSVQIPVPVRAKTITPPVGAIAPPTSNKTVSTVDSLAQLTTGSTPDPTLYQITVDEAVRNGLPTLLVFASPSLCTSPACGPQVETVSEIAAAHRPNANFIHIEVYDNPDGIQGDLSRARYSSSVRDWGLTEIEGYRNESWIFVLEPRGRIAARFEGYASAVELEEALDSIVSA